MPHPSPARIADPQRKRYLKPYEIPTPLPEDCLPVVIPDPGPLELEHRHFFRIVRSLLSWVIYFYLRRLIGRYDPAEGGRRLRNFMEELGGLWIEIGRLLATRSDIFPQEFCNELRQADHFALPFPFEQCEERIRKELGAPYEAFFIHIERRPMVVSSLSQMHRANLRKNGLEVVVKVLRPHTTERFDRDLRHLLKIGAFMRMLHIMPSLRWDEMYFELRGRIQQDTDYRYEAANLKRMRKSLRRHDIYVPKVIQECSSEHVLTMEYMPSVRLTEFIEFERRDPAAAKEWLRENRIDRKIVGKKLFHSFFRQVCEDNLFHGNLRPSNIFLLRDSRFALIDMDTVYTVEKRFLTIYSMMLRALSEKDYEKVADCLFLLCESVPAMNLAEVRMEIVRCYRAYAARADLMKVDYSQKSVSAVCTEAASVMFRHNIVASWEFTRVTNTWKSLDSSLSVLNPEGNFFELIGVYFRKSADRQFKQLKKAGLKPLMSRGVSLISEILMFQTANLRKQAQVFQGYTSKFSYLMSLVFRLAAHGTFIALIFVIFAFLNQHYGFGVIGDMKRDFLEETWFMDLIRSAEKHSYESYMILFIAGIYFVWLLMKLSRRFRADEVTLPSK